MQVSVIKIQGDILREMRNKMGRTQEAMALRAQISKSHISEIETGKKQASEQILIPLLKCYNLTMPELLREIADRLEIYSNAN